MQSVTRKLKYKPEDVSAALDDYKRQQDEETAWNQTPVMDVPRAQTSTQSVSPLAQALNRKMKKVK